MTSTTLLLIVHPACLNIRKGDLDLLAGASPCQPFSKAGQWVSTARLGFADKRADTLSAFLELARRFLPKAILLENVPAFWSTKFPTRDAIADFFADLKKETDIHYRYTTAILNAADYGVPQIRRRFILVAWRTPHEFSWPEKTYLARPMTSWDALHNVTPKTKPLRRGRWADLLPSIPEGKNYIWHTDRGGGMNLFGYRTKYWSFLLKVAKDRPAWTIAAQPGPSTGPFHWEDRPFAVEELLALQTFPNHWQLQGSYRDNIRMIGNATPPLLAECLGFAIRTVLGPAIRRPLTYLPRRAHCVPPPARVRPVPKQYFLLIRNHREHPGPGQGPMPRVERRNNKQYYGITYAGNRRNRLSETAVRRR